MIDIYYWPTPNGHKITIVLEEVGLAYHVTPVNISRGEQFLPYFLVIAPNNRIPAIVDHAPAVGDTPVPVFESGAILLYLAEKSAKLIPTDLQGRAQALQWLFWQVGGLGPIAGQSDHFRHHAPEPLGYAVERYTAETRRRYGVLDKRLAEQRYLAGERYSIADIASYPWIVPAQRLGQSLDDFPHLARWFSVVAARPAVARAYALIAEIQPATEAALALSLPVASPVNY